MLDNDSAKRAVRIGTLVRCGQWPDKVEEGAPATADGGGTASPWAGWRHVPVASILVSWSVCACLGECTASANSLLVLPDSGQAVRKGQDAFAAFQLFTSLTRSRPAA